MKLICWLCFIALMFCAGASVPAQNAAGDLPATGGELPTTAAQQDKDISRQEIARPKWEQELNGKLDSVLLKVVFDSLKQKNVLPESELLSSWESNLSAVRKQALLRELKGDVMLQTELERANG